MKRTIILIFAFLIMLITVTIIYAETSYQIGDYIMKDNASFDKFGNAITLNDSLSAHGWGVSTDGGNANIGRYSQTPDGNRVINLTSTGSWNTSAYPANKTYTASAIISTKNIGGADRGVRFGFKNTSSIDAGGDPNGIGLDWEQEALKFQWVKSGFAFVTVNCHLVQAITITNDFTSVFNVTLTVYNNSYIGCALNNTPCSANCSYTNGIAWDTVYVRTTGGALGYYGDMRIYNGTGLPQSVVEAETIPPSINQNSYNMTSDGGAGCINWRTNKSNPCSTGDVTPTVNFTTNEPASCAIGTQDINFSDYNALVVNRNCTIGQGTQSHTCTLIDNDELVYETSNIFISCEDSSNNQNTTSTSGALVLSITGLEAAGRTSIGLGIQNALLSSYTNYTDQQIYARNLASVQVTGTFDRVATKGGKTWAFNRIGVSDSHVNMFNLTPVLYALEFANTTSSQITLQAELLINATK